MERSAALQDKSASAHILYIRAEASQRSLLPSGVLHSFRSDLPGWQGQFSELGIHHRPCGRHWGLGAEGARVIHCRNSSSYQPSPSGNINIHLRSSEKCFAYRYCEKRKQSASNFLAHYQNQ